MDRSGRLPQPLHSHVISLGRCLGEAAAVGPAAVAALPEHARQDRCRAICTALRGWMELVQRHALAPSAQEAVRTLAAAAVPTEQLARGYGTLGSVVLQPALPLDVLETCAATLEQLVELALPPSQGGESPLPQDVIQVMTRTQLRPAALQAAAVGAAEAAMGELQRGKLLPFHTGRLLATLFKSGPFPDLCRQVQAELAAFARPLTLSLPACTGIIVLATRVLHQPLPTQLDSSEAELGLARMMHAVRLLSAKCFREVRWWQQTVHQRHDLLQQALNVAESLAGTSTEPAAMLRASCLGLASQLVRDAAFAEREGQPIPSSVRRAVVRVLGQLLPDACHLAAQVGAAGPGDGAAAAAAAGPCAAGQMWWHSPGLQLWGELLHNLAEMAGSLEQFEDFSPHLFAQEEAVAAAAAAEAAVRLLPLLPLQPVLQIHGGSGLRAVTTAAAAVDAAGGPAAVLREYLAPEGTLTAEATVVVLSKTLPTIADRLLERNDETEALDEQAAWMAFGTACRYAHALHAALVGRGGGAGAAAAAMAPGSQPILADPDTAVFDAVGLLETALEGVMPCFARWHREAHAETRAEIQRRLECVLLLYLAALKSLPLRMVQSGAQLAARDRQSWLRRLLQQEPLGPLWRLLLQEKGSAAQGSLAALLLEGVPVPLLKGDIQQCLSSSAPGSASEPVSPCSLEQQLVLRCAHALAAGRSSCGNLLCSNLAGASDAAVRGNRCSGCKLVRFCSQQCSRTAWRWHRPACRQLSV